MILIDTSVWIDHPHSSGDDRVAAVLDAGQLLMHSMVLGELACGNRRDRGAVRKPLSNLLMAPRATNDSPWLRQSCRSRSTTLLHPPGMPDTPHALTVHDLTRIGADYLARANAALEHARRSGAETYMPVADTPEEYAGQLLIACATPRQALESVDYELRHVSAGENADLWRAARTLLAHAVMLDDIRCGRVPRPTS